MSEAKAPILITGATGIVGSSILFMLQERMRDVPIRLMVRDVNKAKSSLPENVEYVAGDVTDKQSVSAAVAGCQGVFHAAGMPEQWVPDQSVFDKVNAEGTRIVMDACIEHKVPRVVFTSTMDALEWQDGKPYDESQLAVRPLLSAYQNSKLKATKIVLEYVEKGLQIATIHPSAVYGPGRASAPTMNDVLDKLMKNEMPLILPGGITMVFAEDVAYCHIRAYELLAAGKIPSGTRYLVSGPYQTLAEIAAEVHKNNPPSKVPKELPVFVAKVVAHTGSFFSHFTGKPPLIAPTQLENVLAQGRPVTTKAETELDWKPTAFAEGMQRTIEWLRGIQAVHQAQ